MTLRSGARSDDSGQGASAAEVSRSQDVLNGRARGVAGCPRCLSLDTISLDKVDAWANTCFRCRSCGHIFSPALAHEEG